MVFSCKVKGHTADRRGARHDGEDYWSSCKRCGTTLIRSHDGWREPTEEEVVAHKGNVGAKPDLDSAAGL